MPEASFLTPEVVAAVTAHMNGDHAADNVVICRGLGGCPDATAAAMTGLDLHGLELTATGPGGPWTVRIPFQAPLRERGDIRAEVARMYHEAAAALT